jgi:hypothetical protein
MRMWPRSQRSNGFFSRSGSAFGEDDHLDAGDDQEGAEDVEYPGELLHQPDAGEDHAGAHDDGAEHAVEQHAALQLRRHGEVAEDHDEDEHVVHRQDCSIR